jgi:hypothetical protein
LLLTTSLIQALGGTVIGYEEIGLTAIATKLSAVDVKVANLVGFELLGLLAIDLRQNRIALRSFLIINVTYMR